MERATAIVAAAGSGERLGAGEPKALVEILGVPMIAWSLRALSASERVGRIVVAAPPSHEQDVRRVSLAAADENAELVVVAGGEQRAQSVERALEQVETAVVLVHDAARPLLKTAVVDGVLAALDADAAADAAIAATPGSDTLKLAATADGSDRPAVVERTVPRERIWRAQTPQALRTAALRAALGDPAARAEATDEAMLIEGRGGRVLLVDGGPENVKVTTPSDLTMAAVLLGARD